MKSNKTMLKKSEIEERYYEAVEEYARRECAGDGPRAMLQFGKTSAYASVLGISLAQWEKDTEDAIENCKGAERKAG